MHVRSGTEWGMGNGMEWNGIEWNGMEWNETERNRMKQNETERNRMKQNETERNRMKQNEMEQIRTNTHGPFRSERSGAERSGKKTLRSQSLKEKKVFYIITCTHGAERNGEWNGMEWNGME